MKAVKFIVVVEFGNVNSVSKSYVAPEISIVKERQFEWRSIDSRYEVEVQIFFF